MKKVFDDVKFMPLVFVSTLAMTFVLLLNVSVQVLFLVPWVLNSARPVAFQIWFERVSFNVITKITRFVDNKFMGVE